MGMDADRLKSLESLEQCLMLNGFLFHERLEKEMFEFGCMQFPADWQSSSFTKDMGL